MRRSGRRDWRVGCLRAIRMAPTAAKITSMAIPPTVALPVAAGARCVGRRRDWRRDELRTGRGVGCCSRVTSSRVIAPFPSSSDMLSLTFVLLAAGLPGQSLTVPLDLPAVDTKNARGNYLRPSSRNGNRGRLVRTKGRLNFLTHIMRANSRAGLRLVAIRNIRSATTACASAAKWNALQAMEEKDPGPTPRRATRLPPLGSQLFPPTR